MAAPPLPRFALSDFTLFLSLQNHEAPRNNAPRSVRLVASSKSNDKSVNRIALLDGYTLPSSSLLRIASLTLRSLPAMDSLFPEAFAALPPQISSHFVFLTGKYSDEPSRADEWLSQGKIVNAHPVNSNQKAKDPLFGLTLGTGSQPFNDLFRWFCYEAGHSNTHTVVLLHGFPSQSYSYRNVIPTLSQKYRVLAFDWLGFGFSDKPQPGYGFNYTLDEYSSSLDSLIESISGVDEKLSIVAQGYFSPLIVKFASRHCHKLHKLILLNPPVTAEHGKLPSSLSMFGNFLLGEVFAQDPIRASDKTLISSGPYQMKEEDAVVYRRPYLTSGSAGFALSAVVRAMSRQLKPYVEETREMMMKKDWEVETAICWGMRDRWLSFDGVNEFCRLSEVKLVPLPEAGHHVQQDCGLELGNILPQLIR